MKRVLVILTGAALVATATQARAALEPCQDEGSCGSGGCAHAPCYCDVLDGFPWDAVEWSGHVERNAGPIERGAASASRPGETWASNPADQDERWAPNGTDEVSGWLFRLSAFLHLR